MIKTEKATGLKIALGLFVYDRPEHTRQVLEALRKNCTKKLFVFCDGPKSKSDEEKVNLTGQIIQSIDWCETNIIVRNENIGLVNNIVSGINFMLETHDAAVILEDDCIPREDFWYYMTTCLAKYNSNKDVMHVNGYQLPIKIKKTRSHDVYFSHLPMSWGYGVWKRSWKYFRMDINDSIDFLNSSKSKQLKALNPKFEKRIEDVFTNKIESWATIWTYLINLHNGYCVAPYKSLVKNIGCDGTGTHCTSSVRYDTDIALRNGEIFSKKNPLKLPDTIVVDKYMDEETPYFYGKKRQGSLFRRWIRKNRQFFR